MKRAYLDSSFITCLFISGHTLHASALKCIAMLMADKYKLYISPLVLDESWWAIFKEKNKLGLAKSDITDCINDLNNSWETLVNYKVIKLIQLKNPINRGVNKTLDYIGKFNIHPRDSFHISIANDNKIIDIFVHDSNLLKINPSTKFKIIDFVAYADN